MDIVPQSPQFSPIDILKMPPYPLLAAPKIVGLLMPGVLPPPPPEPPILQYLSGLLGQLPPDRLQTLQSALTEFLDFAVSSMVSGQTLPDALTISRAFWRQIGVPLPTQPTSKLTGKPFRTREEMDDELRDQGQRSFAKLRKLAEDAEDMIAARRAAREERYDAHRRIDL